MNEQEKTAEIRIKEWKKKYGDVYKIQVDGKCCYLKPPTRQIVSYSISLQERDPVEADMVLLKNCWLYGDMEIQDNLNLFLSVRHELGKLFDLKKARLIKL